MYRVKYRRNLRRFNPKCWIAEPKRWAEQGQYNSVLGADRVCPRCGVRPAAPKYVGKLFHDFRRSAAHELWKAGSSIEQCMEVTGHASSSMFKRYADLFSAEERKAKQQATQQKRREWKAATIRERHRHAQAGRPVRTRTKHAQNEGKPMIGSPKLLNPLVRSRRTIR